MEAPNSLNGCEIERRQYGRYALCMAAEASVPSRYEVLSRLLPESSGSINKREVAYVARLNKPLLLEG